MDDIYHPYLRPAREEVEVVVERDSEDGQPTLQLRPNLPGPQHVARVNSLKYLLNLETRWQIVLKKKRLDAELDHTFAIASSFLTEESGLLFSRFDDEWFSHKLSIIIDGEKNFIGRKEWHVPFIAFARWVVVDAQARSEWHLKLLCVLEASTKVYDVRTGQVISNPVDH